MQTAETPARAWHEARLGALDAALAAGESWHARLAACRLAMVAATGDIYFGLWYPVVIALATVVIGLIFVPETYKRDIFKG